MHYLKYLKQQILNLCELCDSIKYEYIIGFEITFLLTKEKHGYETEAYPMTRYSRPARQKRYEARHFHQFSYCGQMLILF